MFNKSTSSVVTDLLFNLLLTFVCLFFLAFVLVNDPKEEEKGQEHDAVFMITMTWEEDCDMDLWMKMPNGQKLFYGRREVGPAFLDVDVVTWKRFRDSSGNMVFVTPNQEIATIRGGSMVGKHVLAAHYFGGGQKEIKVTIVVHDVFRRKVVYMGEKTFDFAGQEQYFATIDILELGIRGGKMRYTADYSDRNPEPVVGR